MVGQTLNSKDTTNKTDQNLFLMDDAFFTYSTVLASFMIFLCTVLCIFHHHHRSVEDPS